MLELVYPVVVILAVFSFVITHNRARQIAGGDFSSLHSRPFYHGLYGFLWVLLSGLAVLVIGSTLWRYVNDQAMLARIFAAAPELPNIEARLILSDAKAIAIGSVSSASDSLRQAIAADFRGAENFRVWGVAIAAFAAAGLAGLRVYRGVARESRARNKAEGIVRAILLACATIAVLTTIGIVLSLVFETFSFFAQLDWRVDKFLFGTRWSPLSGVQSGVLDASRVGAAPLFVGTLLITLVAMLVAVPIGLFAAIYLSEFATPRVRAWAKPMLEILAGIPTVVYGFFAAITFAPLLRGAGGAVGLDVASESALAAGVVMGIMIIPFISSLSDDVINSVPQSLRDGSYALGATQAETIRQVVLPAALPGIVSAILLGVSRAVGETMIVVMAAGQGANLTVNPLEAVTTVTVQIVMLITGDTEASTAAGPAFALGFTLFCMTLLLNIVALKVVRRYREMYD